jgi:AcrR family transcriptional regulator
MRTSRRKPAAAPRRPSRVRARTRALLVEAAVRLYARKGVGATAIHEIAAEAGVANGTFYNYFRTREEVLEAATVHLAERLHEEISASAREIDDPAERVAIGSRRFVLQAMHDPAWAAALLRVWGSTAASLDRAAAPMLADLRAGRRAGRFTYRSETAAVDLLSGAVLAGMRTMLEGRAREEHAAQVVALVLRGLGVEAEEAEAIARRPLPTPDWSAAAAKSRMIRAAQH